MQINSLIFYIVECKGNYNLFLQGGTLLGEPDRVEELGQSQVPYQLFLEYIFGLGESSYK